MKVWYICGSRIVVCAVVDPVALCYVGLLCPMVAWIVNGYGLLLLQLGATEALVACIVYYYGLLRSLRVVMVENSSLCSTT